jgi:hypothetical protein
MRTDTVLRNEGFQVLMEHMGLVEAERFIMLIQKEPFDYTQWQENLFEDMSIEEISQKAADYRKQQQQTLLSRDKKQKRIATFA